MKQILNFVTNNWTLRMVLIITGLFVASSLIFRKSVTGEGGHYYILGFLVSCLGIWEKNSKKRTKKRTTTKYKNNAQPCLNSKLSARLLSLIVLRTIRLASSHCFYTGRCTTFFGKTGTEMFFPLNY